MKNYVSLIMDIENSRGYNIDDRNKMQEFIVECIEQLNKAFHNALEFEVVFSAGDELQGLFRDLTSAVMYFRIFEMMIRPAKIRVGIGVGEWNIKVSNGISTQQDGPAYHMAREAIEEVRKKQTQRYRIKFSYEEEFVNNLLNASFVMKEQQGYMQNIALIILELLYPFEKEGMIVYDYKIIGDLLNIKYHYRIGERRFSIAGNRGLKKEEGTEHLNKKRLEVIEPIKVDGINFDAEEQVIKRNMSSQVAEVLGCSRQNADVLIRRGNSVMIRNLDYIALQYIEKGM